MFFYYGVDKEKIKRILREDSVYLERLNLILSTIKQPKINHHKDVNNFVIWKTSKNNNKYIVHELEMLNNLKNAVDEKIKVLPVRSKVVKDFLWRHNMINVLIVDPQECSCFLIKSILLGKRFGVSIATSYDESYLKINTGLFDMLFVDASNAAKENFEFVNNVLREFNNFPVVVLCKEEQSKHWDKFNITSLIKKPIKVAAILDAAKKCLKRMQDNISQTIFSKDMQFTCAISKEENNESIECCGTRISRKGILIEANKSSFTEINRFHWFFKNNSYGVFKTDITTTDGVTATGNMRIAFVERSPDSKIKIVGLTVDNEDESMKSRLSGFFSN